MPCSCWYNPPEASKKLIKTLCQQIVDEIKRLEKEGDPVGVSIEETKKLLEHLYDTSRCNERIPTWISVTDYLPKHNQRIRVKSADLWYGEGIFQDGKFVYSYINGACFGDITHWMAIDENH